jgi:hypothetical protein
MFQLLTEGFQLSMWSASRSQESLGSDCVEYRCTLQKNAARNMNFTGLCEMSSKGRCLGGDFKYETSDMHRFPLSLLSLFLSLSLPPTPLF